MWDIQTRTRVPDGCEGADTDLRDDPGDDALDLGADDQRLADAVDRWVKRRLDALREEAEAIRMQFEARLRAELQTRERSDWGRIGLRVRQQPSPPATPGTFTIEWCTYSITNPANAKAYYTNYIPKGLGDRYPKSAFCGKLRGWQRPIVDATETRLAAIRRAVRHIAQVRTQLRAAVRVERAMREVLRTDQEERAD